MRHLLSAACLLAATGAAAGTDCATELDCSLNGACDAASGACACDKGWAGATCDTLHLDPTAHVAYGYTNTSSVSSWGGGPPVHDAATGKYHLFVSEIAAHCGMSTWARMSQSVHAVATAVEGPYARAADDNPIIPTVSHNTIYAYSAPDKTHLIYTIFEGTSPQSCNPYLACTSGTTPGGEGLHPPAGWPAANCTGGPGARGVLHYSKSLDGPWTSAGPITYKYSNPGGVPRPPNAGTSNPAPYVFPNGTVLLLGRGKDSIRNSSGTFKQHNIFLYRAPSWNATYEWVPSDGVGGALNVGAGNDGPSTEDPVLYRGRRGFHIIFHSHPDLTHAWSEDGLRWRWSKTVSGPPNHMDVGGGDNERPRVVLDSNGDLEWLFVGQLGVDAARTDGARTAAFKALAPST